MIDELQNEHKQHQKDIRDAKNRFRLRHYTTRLGTMERNTHLNLPDIQRTLITETIKDKEA